MAKNVRNRWTICFWGPVRDSSQPVTTSYVGFWYIFYHHKSGTLLSDDDRSVYQPSSLLLAETQIRSQFDVNQLQVQPNNIVLIYWPPTDCMTMKSSQGIDLSNDPIFDCDDFPLVLCSPNEVSFSPPQVSDVYNKFHLQPRSSQMNKEDKQDGSVSSMSEDASVSSMDTDGVLPTLNNSFVPLKNKEEFYPRTPTVREGQPHRYKTPPRLALKPKLREANRYNSFEHKPRANRLPSALPQLGLATQMGTSYFG